MKFSQVADGQQFEYQGAIYTRHGPMMAVDENGNSRLIPRSAEVSPATGKTPGPAPDRQRPITVEQAIDSFEIFYERLINCLQDKAAGTDKIKLPDVQQCLETARQAYLKNL